MGRDGNEPFLTPEEEELRSRQAELDQLEASLYEAEVQLATLRAELQAFEGRYLRVVGVKIAELDDIEAEIVELIARRRPQDPDAKVAANRARARARESSEASAGAASREPARFQPSAEMKQLYRDVAKRVHPDLVADPRERSRRNALMARANAAYAAGDRDALATILRDAAMSAEAVQGEGVAFELVRVLRKISQVRRRLRAIEKEQTALRESDMFRLKQQVEEAADQGRDMLADIAAQLDTKIEGAQGRLRRLQEVQGS